jgi:hypothetical protein
MSWLKSKTHRDGTVSYYSDIQHQWIERVREIPAKELAQMDILEKFRLIKYLENYKDRQIKEEGYNAEL